MAQCVEYPGKGPFDFPVVSSLVEISEKALSENGLTWHSAAPGANLVCSTPERAMLELCDGVSDAAGVYEGDALLQDTTPLHPAASACCYAITAASRSSDCCWPWSIAIGMHG